MDNKMLFDYALNLLGKTSDTSDMSSGLRFVSSKSKERNPDIYLSLEIADKYHVTAVYFRFYTDNRPPKPIVYIYDKVKLNKSISNPSIHHMLWNAGIVPICFIFELSKILVYNCSNRPKWDNKGEKFITPKSDIINLLSTVSESLDRYNFKNFDSGLFWESETGRTYNNENSAYEQLLKQLQNVKRIIINKEGRKHASLIKKILMMLILIKYLEERKDEEGNGALNPDEFYKPFCDGDVGLDYVLKSTESFINMLDELSSKNHFNGRIFYLDEKEKNAIRNEIDLSLFVLFVRGDVSFISTGRGGIGQMSLWKLYQFNYLPIELISHIYEDFLTDINGEKKKGVVYTPPSLVQMLIDKTMPLREATLDFKVLDPACGSGIFLVGAFKRIIQWWRLLNDWAYPQKENIEEIKGLLKKNIYGCDIEPEAVTLTYFSLSLALLDSLSPKEIWENVHFDNLIGTNLFPIDFFKVLNDKQLRSDFQLVIGNPPFKSELSEGGNSINKDEMRANPERPDIPDKQISLLFLEQSMRILKDGGNCCMIMPSGPVLYNINSHQFKKYLFEKYYAKEIYDFSALRVKLFAGSSTSAKPSVIAIVLEKSTPQNEPSTHYIFRWTNASGEKIEFEIDYYDIHQVPYIFAVNKPQVWQTNFFGGGRLHNLMDRISRTRTLGDYLDDKVKNNDWEFAEGWIEGKDNIEIQRVKKLSLKKEKSGEELIEFERLEKKFKADWITGHNFVETEDFTDAGVKKTDVCNIEYFYRSSKTNKKIFERPHLLIKEQAGKKSIPMELRNDYLTFKNEIIGIHAPSTDLHLLKLIEHRYKNNKSYSALLWLLSGRIITIREGVVLKADIMSLPYPEEPIEFNRVENILLDDIIDHYSEFRIKGDESDLLLEVSNKDLEEFGIVYSDILNSIYDKFKPLNPIVGKKFVVYPFILGDNPEIEIPNNIEEIEDKISNLINSKDGNNLWVKRIIRIYHQNIILMYKPIQKRYWLPSIAVRDADETFVDLFKQGK